MADRYESIAKLYKKDELGAPLWIKNPLQCTSLGYNQALQNPIRP